MNKVYYGTVVWFDNKKSYGFIAPDDGGTDIFVHFTDIISEGFKTVKKDQLVQYSIGENNRGQPKAIEVLVVQK